MKNWKVYLQAGAWSTLVLLLVPPLWYSLRTNFALVDDYGDFDILGWFSHVSSITQWWHDTWFVPTNRFRISYDLYQGVTWALFGDNSALHHGMRWVLKAVVVWVTFKIMRLMAPNGRSMLGLSFWVFCAVYIFFPNNPEARLAPQEMLLVFFLALLFYELACLLVRAQGDLAKLSLGRYLWLLVVFTGMIWSKEPAIVMGFITFMVIVGMNLKRWPRLLPFAVILLVTGLRILTECKAGGYGKAPVTGDLLSHNIAFHGKSLLFGKVFLLGALLLGLGSLIFQTWKIIKRDIFDLRGIVQWLQSHPILVFYWLVCLNTLVFSLTFLSMWHWVLRYFYPLVYLLSLWVGLVLLEIESLSIPWRRAVTVLAITASIYFIGANYYNFVYQFANQYYTRAAEQVALQNVNQLLKNGRTVTLTPDDEYEDSIGYYFNRYLPFYMKTDYRINIGPIVTQHEGCYYITRDKRTLPTGHYWYRHVDLSHVSKILWWSERVSSLFYLGHSPFYWRDLGADWIGRHGEAIPDWYLYNCSDIWGSPKQV